MRSSDARVALAVGLAIATSTGAAAADEPAPGFAVDRFSSPVPGSRWLVSDSLDMKGELEGAVAVTLGYAHDALRVPAPVVRDRAYAGFGVAATHDRFRLSLAGEAPLLMKGESAASGGYAFTPPNLDLGSHPDTLSDVRIGLDARVLGEPDARFRLGVGGQLFVPAGDSADYVSDDRYRGIVRVGVAGDLSRVVSYAGFVGVHVRTTDARPVPEAPQGSELLSGVAGAVRIVDAPAATLSATAEIFGASAFRSLLGRSSTGAEALFGGLLEVPVSEESRVRLKIGVGPGVSAHFGAPAWRSALTIEVLGGARR